MKENVLLKRNLQVFDKMDADRGGDIDIEEFIKGYRILLDNFNVKSLSATLEKNESSPKIESK